MMKTLNKVGLEGAYRNIIKGINDIPTANIMLNSEKKLSPKIMNKVRMSPILPLMFNIVLKS